MDKIKFKIAAKTDVGMVRTNNEDNFQAASDLSKESMTWVNDQECTLGAKGALLVVADGMGGMNAGEVASNIAIETVREMFTPDKLTESVLKSKASIDKYLKSVIITADKNIKEDAKSNADHQGMGTTIVIAWLLENKLYVAWCGDSRAYIYNDRKGLVQITKDHSYVQELVDAGKLSKEEAFDFPESNIITRCLSASSTKAEPEVISKAYEVENGDIIMLCTDGLSGLLRDYQIEQLLRENNDNMETCISTLIHNACQAGGHDNVTVAMCNIVSGAKQKTVTIKKYNTENITSSLVPTKHRSYKSIIWGILLVFSIGFFTGGFSYYHFEGYHVTDSLSDTIPTLSVETVFVDKVVRDTIRLQPDPTQLQKLIKNAVKDSLKKITNIKTPVATETPKANN